MSVSQLRQMLERATREKPSQLDGFFQRLNHLIRKERSADGETEVYQFLKAIKAGNTGGALAKAWVGSRATCAGQ